MHGQTSKSSVARISIRRFYYLALHLICLLNKNKGLTSMNVPFIRNHHYNYIQKQANGVLSAYRTVSDPKILESVRMGAITSVTELFPDVADHRKTMLESISELKTAEDFHKFMHDLVPYVIEPPSVTEQQIRKLFPKNKKLKMPKLAEMDFRFMTYLSWIDIASNKKYIVYQLDGQWIGIEGRYTPTHKKSYCFVCNKFGEIALFSAIAQKRPVNVSPDYYKSVGNYICASGEPCNKNVSNVESLEQFIRTVVG